MIDFAPLVIKLIKSKELQNKSMRLGGALPCTNFTQLTQVDWPEGRNDMNISGIIQVSCMFLRAETLTLLQKICTLNYFYRRLKTYFMIFNII